MSDEQPPIYPYKGYAYKKNSAYCEWNLEINRISAADDVEKRSLFINVKEKVGTCWSLL